ncbi:hypothetical protein [Rufibacter sp. XAAS-G3-1]|uniref:hypothetical protein n=1 Tax=Rufibacter sp. XAAS-G3-1 TaxID=2729134 RepID=UPI0015E6D916|nr:hypothetical protein [Rufibacter sp. XAAS-G3-1]
MKPAALFLLSLLFYTVSLRAYSQERTPSPFHVKAQFAGDLGFLSVGAGRSFLKEKLETDLFLGYLPQKIGGDRIFTTAIKATYVPLRAIQVTSLDWQSLRTGLQLGYTFGNEYFAFEPHDKYPKSYYGFSTALHLYYFLGGQVDFTRVEKLNRFGIYYEVGSNVEYIVSYVQNPAYLSPAKIFNLALGVRMKL